MVCWWSERESGGQSECTEFEKVKLLLLLLLNVRTDDTMKPCGLLYWVEGRSFATITPYLSAESGAGNEHSG